MTEEKEKKLKERIMKLEKKLNEFKRKLDELPQVIYEIDTEGNFLYVNKTGMAIFGYDITDLKKGMSVKEIFAEEDLERVKKNIKHQLKNAGKEVHEYTAKNKNGKRIPVLVYSSVIKSNGDVVGIRGVAVNISKRKELERKLKEQSIRDSLTGLYNYGYLKEVSKKEANRSQRHNYKIGIIIFDINYLKNINDMYGHQEGDEVIKQVANILNKTTREEDVVFRYGGDEFLILLPQTSENQDNCKTALNKLQKRIKKKLDDWNKNNPLDIPLTLAMGCYDWNPKEEDFEEAFKVADDRMYEQKRSYHKGVEIKLNTKDN